MRAVLQRVARACVRVDDEIVGRIERGWLVLLGVAEGDADADADWMAEKIAVLRGFEDDAGKMNRDVAAIGGGVLVVSQFTLLGDCRKGRRPGFDQAADPETANRLYQKVVERLAERGLPVATGVFRAHMMVELINDGPVTFCLEGRKPV